MIKIEIIDPQAMDASVLRKTAAYLLALAAEETVTITLPAVSKVGDTVEIDAKGRNVTIYEDAGIEDTRYRTLEDIGLKSPMPVPPPAPIAENDIPWNEAAIIQEEIVPVAPEKVVVTPPKKRASRAKPAAPVAPVAPAVPTPPPAVEEIDEYAELMELITNSMSTGKLPIKLLRETLAEFECTSVVMIKDIPGLLPKALKRFKEVLSL